MAKQVNVRLSDIDYKRVERLKKSLYPKITDSSFCLELILSALDDYEKRLDGRELVSDTEVRLRRLEERLEAIELNLERGGGVETVDTVGTVETVETVGTVADSSSEAQPKPVGDGKPDRTYESAVRFILERVEQGEKPYNIARVLTERKYHTKNGRVEWQSGQVQKVLTTYGITSANN